jgi:hypothetical protein
MEVEVESQEKTKTDKKAKFTALYSIKQNNIK